MAMALNTMIFKLLNGDNIIGGHEPGATAHNPTVTIFNPVRILVVPGRPGQEKNPTVAFAPWEQFSDDPHIVIDKSHILAIMTPIKDFIEQYKRIFSKIAQPETKLILPGM